MAKEEDLPRLAVTDDLDAHLLADGVEKDALDERLVHPGVKVTHPQSARGLIGDRLSGASGSDVLHVVAVIAGVNVVVVAAAVLVEAAVVGGLVTVGLLVELVALREARHDCCGLDDCQLIRKCRVCSKRSEGGSAQTQ